MSDAPNSNRRGRTNGTQRQDEPSRNGEGPNRPGSGGPNQPPNLRPSRGLFGFVTILTIGFILFLMMSSMGTQAVPLSTWQEFRNLYETGKIKDGTVEVRDTGIVAETVPGKLPEGGVVMFRFGPGDKDFFLKQVDELTKGRFVVRPSSIWTQILLSLLPFLIIIFLLWFLLFRGLRSAAGGPGGMLGSFGKSRHRLAMKEKTGVTFADVAGIDEAKDEVQEIIEFLKNPKRFMRLGGRIPRGVLLTGDPGCGKTLLAKAIAGEADVPFFSISGSDFVEMFVGVGASRVRDLFKQAKDSAPCIIFLDEIDAVGRRRGGGFTTGGHDEREQTLNAILVEMDGFSTSDGVIVIASTNRPDVLDPALTRPGRFDRQVSVPLPDVKGRLEILQVHAKKVKLGPGVNLERLAKATPMFSGADLAAIINEAAISATLHNKDFVEQDDLEEARDKIKFGRAKKSRVREADDNKLTAYHEAGHAVLQAVLPDGDALHKVTIIPRGSAGGATFSLPERDRMGYGLKWLGATLRVACGGRIAEAKAMGDVSSGAVSDIARVTQIARTMVEEWGMSAKLGFIRYAAADTREMFIPERAYSDDTARVIDEEVKRIVSEAYDDASRLLDQNWDKVVAVAEALLKYETLDADEVHRLMRGEPLGKPTISDLLAAEARKAREAAGAPAAPSQPESPDLPPGAMPRPA
ncbi:MAG: ATP-dependent zinc metalloprotease FtsH [Phycisphaeraceae bacterium]|nr:ATP-dependent zinc metalloprotease FtsH [Phycisphaeraceae bacterium]